jgi:hypothetical protein
MEFFSYPEKTAPSFGLKSCNRKIEASSNLFKTDLKLKAFSEHLSHTSQGR